MGINSKATADVNVVPMEKMHNICFSFSSTDVILPHTLSTAGCGRP